MASEGSHGAPRDPAGGLRQSRQASRSMSMKTKSCQILAFHKLLWNSLHSTTFYGIHCIPQDSMDSIGFHRIPCIPQNYIGFYGFHWIPKDSLDFIRFCRILWISLDSIRFYAFHWIPQDSINFIVSLGFYYKKNASNCFKI